MRWVLIKLPLNTFLHNIPQNLFDYSQDVWLVAPNYPVVYTWLYIVWKVVNS